MAGRSQSRKHLHSFFKVQFKKFKLPRGKRLALLILFSAPLVVIVGLGTLPIFSTTKLSTLSIPFSTQKVNDSSLELNDSQQKQAGISGEKTVTVHVSKTLLNILFGGQTSESVISSKVTKAPTPQIVASGTKRYQYMYCSNGTYRYYTNDQFKSPSVGFTHKSPDYCAQNHEGTETQLADAPPQKATSSSAFISPVSLSVPNCTTTSIPYGIDYQDVSWLPLGQTETYPGLNGTYFSCLGTTVQPVNETVYIGTGPDYNAEAQQYARTLAREKCTTEYNSAMAQIGILGAGNSSAADLISQYYSQCLSAAG